ncbi:hypothetical protein E2I00_007242, partial [Balaenoptera physalus]
YFMSAKGNIILQWASVTQTEADIFYFFWDVGKAKTSIDDGGEMAQDISDNRKEQSGLLAANPKCFGCPKAGVPDDLLSLSAPPSGPHTRVHASLRADLGTLDCGACRVQGKADYMKEDIKEKKGIREGHKVKFKVKETTVEAVFQHTPVLLCTPVRTCCHPAELSLCQSRAQMAGPAFPLRSQVKQDSLKMLCKADADEVKPGKECLHFQFLEWKHGYCHHKDCRTLGKCLCVVWTGHKQGLLQVVLQNLSEVLYPYRIEDTTCQNCKQTRSSCLVKLRHIDSKRPCI